MRSRYQESYPLDGQARAALANVTASISPQSARLAWTDRVTACDGDDRLASPRLFTAPADFSEPGERGLFIDASRGSLRETQMREKGGLCAGQMAGAFHRLRSCDPPWSRVINGYLPGERRPPNHPMARDAATPRMPARMQMTWASGNGVRVIIAASNRRRTLRAWPRRSRP